MPYALLSCSFVTELYFLNCIVIVSLNEINGDGDGEARPIHGLKPLMWCHTTNCLHVCSHMVLVVLCCLGSKSFSTGRTQCTKIGAVLSHITDVISGVIQGSVLGPLMFLTLSMTLMWTLFKLLLMLCVDGLRPGNYRSLLTSVVSCMLVSLRPMFPSLLVA